MSPNRVQLEPQGQAVGCASGPLGFRSGDCSQVRPHLGRPDFSASVPCVSATPNPSIRPLSARPSRWKLDFAAANFTSTSLDIYRIPYTNCMHRLRAALLSRWSGYESPRTLTGYLTRGSSGNPLLGFLHSILARFWVVRIQLLD